MDEMAKINITERAIRALKPPPAGTAAVVYTDREVAGFGVRITAAGVASFILNYSIHGAERRMTIGRCAEMDAKTARERALEYRQQVRDGIDPQAERKQVANDGHMVNELADEYLSKHAARHKRASSAKNDAYMLKGIIRPRLGPRPVSAIDRETIEQLHHEIGGTAEEPAAPTQANRVLSLLRKMFNKAVEWGWRADNPASKIKPYPEDKNNDWLSEEQVARLKVALNNYQDQDVANAFRLLIYTGARQPEVLNAEWKSFNLDRAPCTWDKKSADVKEDEQSILPLNDAASALLRRMYAERDPACPYLFPAPPPLVARPGGYESKHSPTRQGLLSQWRTICKRAGLAETARAPRPKGAKPSWRRHVKPLYVVHVLRHTFASQLASEGESLEVIGKLLGHKNPKTTQRYAHLKPEALLRAANRIKA
jgi:integrase